ncbi:hypothetical protein D3C75_1228860 [compost metagenome]
MPQFGVLLTAVERLLAEYPVMFAAHFFAAVTHGFAKILIGLDHDAIGGEFNHSHGPTDSRQLGVGFGQRAAETFDFQQVSLVMQVKHGRITYAHS